VLVFMITGISGFNIWRDLSSSASFHERMKAPITGDTHLGMSLNSSPARQATHSITQACPLSAE
jgi:hypothetical protein